MDVMKFSGGLSSGSSYKYFLGQWQQAALGERIITSSHINYDGLHLCLMVVQWSWSLYRWPATLVTVSSCTVCLEGYHYHCHVSPFVMHVNWVLCIKNHWYWCLESIYLNMQLSFPVCSKIDDLGNHVLFLPFFTSGYSFHDQYQLDYLQSSVRCPKAGWEDSARSFSSSKVRLTSLTLLFAMPRSQVSSCGKNGHIRKCLKVVSHP